MEIRRKLAFDKPISLIKLKQKVPEIRFPYDSWQRWDNEGEGAGFGVALGSYFENVLLIKCNNNNLLFYRDCIVNTTLAKCKREARSWLLGSFVVKTASQESHSILENVAPGCHLLTCAFDRIMDKLLSLFCFLFLCVCDSSQNSSLFKSLNLSSLMSYYKNKAGMFQNSWSKCHFLKDGNYYTRKRKKKKILSWCFGHQANTKHLFAWSSFLVLENSKIGSSERGEVKVHMNFDLEKHNFLSRSPLIYGQMFPQRHRHKHTQPLSKRCTPSANIHTRHRSWDNADRW